MDKLSTIEDFNVLEKLGDGSFSSVYKVQRKSDMQYYAMKKVNISLQSHKERENALNEIRILASIDSPYVVEFKDSFLDRDSNVLYIIMAFATGGDLNRVLAKCKPKGMEEKEIWNALVQILLGIKTLHDSGILHRDLKLANVFATLTPEGYSYQVGDLNISKVTKGANARTQAGTPYYAAPEVWRGDQYSWPCDIWSLGCIIYELAAGQPPFRAADLQSLNRRIQTGVFDPIPNRYSKQLSDVIALMLQVTPRNRPTCDALLKNPIVIKSSGQLLVEGEQDGRKVNKLLQTIKLPYNLKQLKGNLPKANYEVKPKRASSVSGRRADTEVSQTPQPEKSKMPDMDRPPIQRAPVQQQQQQQQYQQSPQVPSNKPPLLKPPSSARVQQPPLAVKVAQQEQRLLGQLYSPNYGAQNSKQQPQPYYGVRAQSPRNNSRQGPAGMPSSGGMRRQQSAGAIRR